MQPAISIISYKSVNEENRIDPDYYLPVYLDTYKVLTSKKTSTLQEISNTCDLQSNGAFKTIFEILNDDNAKVVPYIKSENVGNFFLKTESLDFISQEAHQRLSKTHTQYGDVLMARKGKIGGATLITLEDENFNSNDNVTNIRINSNQIIPEFLTTYLNCRYGLLQVERLSTGNVQPWLSMHQLRSLLVVMPNLNLQLKIKEVINAANELRLSSESLQKKSLEKLLSHLGFADFTPSTVNYSSRSSKEATETNRLDGEYWLPMYDEIEKKIVEYPHGYDAFDKLIEVSSETISPDADETYKYAELSNVIASIGLIEDASEKNGNELPSRARMKLRKNDVVLSSVEGSADKVAIVKVENSNLVGSTGFFVLRKKHLLPEVILALLRIPHINTIYKRQAQGTILTAVPRSSLSRVILPKIPEQFQHEIASQVQEAHKLHNESKRLLEVAKRAVEVFIEQDEDATLEYIKKNYPK